MPAPLLGQHTGYVCREMLRMGDEGFVDLYNQGVEIGYHDYSWRALPGETEAPGFNLCSGIDSSPSRVVPQLYSFL